MKDKLMKMMAKKKEGADSMSEPEKNAKMSVLKELHKMATDAMAGRLHGVKEVKVASDSEEGLEHGLDKAKHMLHGQEMAGSADHMEDDTNMDHEHEDEESPEHEEMESPEERMTEGEDDEHEDMPEHEIDAKLEKLMALKRRKGMK